VRVALVCPYDWARPGGVQAHVGQLAAYLQASAGHVVSIVAPCSQPVEDQRLRPVGRPVPVPFNRSRAPVAVSPAAALRVRAALEDCRPELVHVHEPLAPVVAAAATAVAPHPLVGTFHAWSRSDRLYRLAARAGRRLARRLDERVAVSPAAREFAAGALGLALGAIRVIPNGVDVAAFAGAQPLPQLHDRERPLLLFVGRLEPRKGLEVAIRAFLRLRTVRPGVRLCVVGAGPTGRRCQEMVPPSLRPDVLFVGQVAAAELPRYHASADVFLAPAVGGESFGIVLLEAMAAGLPVVGSNLPGYRAILQDGRQGRLVPAGDAAALADAVATLLANPRLRLAMGREGKRTAAAYDWGVVGAQVAEVYRTVLAGRTP
jgi:phosphatidylinositol alpha-mannosyltransferase